MTTPDWTGAIARARDNAPYLGRLLDREKDVAALLAEGRGEEALALVRSAGESMRVEDTPIALRREKRGIALALAIGDLAGAFPLLRVTGELSALADRALDAAIVHAIANRTPDAEPAGMIALALGKHGACELNYSSDIDPILLYDPALLPRRERDEPGEAAQRLARDIVQTMGRIDGDGYVFRIDLRLRPQSEVSPLAIPIEAALTHYESSALAWERAAFIRARACAGDLAAGQAFLAAIRPFVWRKSLDFGAIAEIGRQLELANTVVQAAVAEAKATDSEIEAFASAAQKIGDVVKMMIGRAERIARTEVAESFNGGRYATMKEAGVERIFENGAASLEASAFYDIVSGHGVGVLALPLEAVRVTWMPGPGSYGMNDADDAAIERFINDLEPAAAALVEGAPGSPTISG